MMFLCSHHFHLIPSFSLLGISLACFCSWSWEIRDGGWKAKWGALGEKREKLKERRYFRGEGIIPPLRKKLPTYGTTDWELAVGWIQEP